MLETIPSQGYQLSPLRKCWYQNKLPKSFGSREIILPEYGHRRGHFRIFHQFLNLVWPPNSFGMMSSNYSKLI